MLIIAGAGLSGHRRDEYLQAARLSLDPERVRIELDLTPGIAVAESVLAEIDRDKTSAISADEAQAYVAIVRNAIRIEIDGRVLPVELVTSTFPVVEAMREGEGAIRVELTAVLPALSAGAHRLLYRNSHRPDIGVYLANTMKPASDRVAVTSQRRIRSSVSCWWSM